MESVGMEEAISYLAAIMHHKQAISVEEIHDYG